MGSTEDRKKAYLYIIDSVQERLSWIPTINSDERLADTLDIPISEILSLKAGKSDPSEKIVNEFKKLLHPVTQESEFDLYLVKPFKQ